MRPTVLSISLIVLTHRVMIAQNLQTEFRSPDKRTAVHQTGYREPFVFTDTRTGKVLASFNSCARFIGVLWSDDNRWAAVSEQCSRFRSPIQLFAVSPETITRISLPNELKSDPLKLLPKSQAPTIVHEEGFGFTPKKWMDHGRLLIEASGGGTVEDHPVGSTKDCTVTFRFVVECHRHGSARLIEKKLIDIRFENQ